MQHIKSAINGANVSAHVNELLQRLTQFDNIPRKKIKFFNFVKNCMKVRNDSIIEQMWSIFEQANKQTDSQNSKDPIISSQNTQLNDTKMQNTDNKRNINQVEEMDSTHNKKIKALKDQEENILQTDTNLEASNDRIKMIKLVKTVLTNAKNNQMSINKLKKKVIFIILMIENILMSII